MSSDTQPDKITLDIFFATYSGWKDIKQELHKEDGRIKFELNYLTGIHPTKAPTRRCVIASASTCHNELFKIKQTLVGEQRWTYMDNLLKEVSDGNYDLTSVEGGHIPEELYNPTARQQALALYKTLKP